MISIYTIIDTRCYTILYRKVGTELLIKLNGAAPSISRNQIALESSLFFVHSPQAKD